jgi:hypothetical protein
MTSLYLLAAGFIAGLAYHRRHRESQALNDFADAVLVLVGVPYYAVLGLIRGLRPRNSGAEE